MNYITKLVKEKGITKMIFEYEHQMRMADVMEELHDKLYVEDDCAGYHWKHWIKKDGQMYNIHFHNDATIFSWDYTDDDESDDSLHITNCDNDGMVNSCKVIYKYNGKIIII